LHEGWNDFQAKRGDLLLLAMIYPLVAFAAAALAFNAQLVAMFFPMVAGLSLLGPAVATGFYELARRREAGEDSSWLHFFDPLNGRNRLSLAILTTCLLGIFGAWMTTAAVIYNATLGPLPPAGIDSFLRAVATTPAGWMMIVLGNLAGLVFAVITLVVSIASFPMIVDKATDPGIAILTSFRAVQANPKAVAQWGLWVAALLFVGCIPAFVGLAVVLPVLGYASWHLYTRLVER